jgi:hypothetical protein
MFRRLQIATRRECHAIDRDEMVRYIDSLKNPRNNPNIVFGICDENDLLHLLGIQQHTKRIGNAALEYPRIVFEWPLGVIRTL